VESKIKNVVLVMVRNSVRLDGVVASLIDAGYLAVGIKNECDARQLLIAGFRPQAAVIDLGQGISQNFAAEVLHNLPAVVMIVAARWSSGDQSWTMLSRNYTATEVLAAVDHRLGGCVVYLLGLARGTA
jgi:hypothetical protein